MFRITKEFHFSASHQLSQLESTHPCARLHGHNYIVCLVLEAKALNASGFVRDYRELDFFKNYIDTYIDHRHLNEVFQHESVTAEFLAQHFYTECKRKIPELVSVRVSETPKTWAEYRPDPV